MEKICCYSLAQTLKPAVASSMAYGILLLSSALRVCFKLQGTALDLQFVFIALEQLTMINCTSLPFNNGSEHERGWNAFVFHVSLSLSQTLLNIPAFTNGFARF